MKKRKNGRFVLLEALEFLDETIIVGNYPADGTGVSDGDDTPTSNILMAPRYKKIKYYNRLNKFNTNWTHDDEDWNWGDFENAKGQENIESYSNTLQAMKDLFPEDTWKLMWKRMKRVSDKEVEREFKKSLKIDRPVKNQLGKDKEDHVEINTKKYAFKDSNVTDKTIKESVLTDKIDVFMI